MKDGQLSRREMLGVTVTALGAAGAALGAEGGQNGSNKVRNVATGPVRFRYCLNTGTIRGQKLGIVKEVAVTAAAGYQAIEPWVGDLRAYAEGGGSLRDLRKRIADAGLTVESAIDFSRWIADDAGERSKGVEQMKKAMGLLAEIGGRRIAAPPAGATRKAGLDLSAAAQRYRAILEAGDRTGVTPGVELWGFSQNLRRLGECLYVAIESGHPKACFIGDVYHIYKGGSDFSGLRLLSGQALPVLHMNDYPAEPNREKIADRDRVMPGDGVAPLGSSEVGSGSVPQNAGATGVVAGA